MKMKILLTAIAVWTASLAFGIEDSTQRKPPVIPIHKAIEKGLLDVQIFGVADTRFFQEMVDKDGIHFGKCMAILMKSNIDSLVLIKIDSGTELIPFDTTFQTMIVTKTVELPLFPGETYATRFYAMCGQIHDAPPYIQSGYKVGEQSDSITVKLARYFETNFIQNMIGQHALWAYTDKADAKELQKYGADSLTIALTKDILNKLSIKTILNNEKQKVQDLQDHTIKVSRMLVYFTGVFVFLLFATTIYLLLRTRRRNREFNA